MGKVFFEVLFRGENEKRLLAWKPRNEDRFACTSTEAQERAAELVAKGIDAISVDGTVPFVVEIRRLKSKFRQGTDWYKIDSMLTQYCEPNAQPWGPWALTSEPSPRDLN